MPVYKPLKSGKNYLFVDGYNIIFAWSSLTKIADYSLEDARKKLLDILSDYQGSSGHEVIVVFDAHNVAEHIGSTEAYSNLTVIYTKEGESADNYIEFHAAALAKEHNVRVATNDNLQQIIVSAKGVSRITAGVLFDEIAEYKNFQNSKYVGKKPIKRNQLFDNLDDELKGAFMDMIQRKGGDQK